MTLNAEIALILHFFPPNSTDFQADYITAVEDRLHGNLRCTYTSPFFTTVSTDVNRFPQEILSSSAT